MPLMQTAGHVAQSHLGGIVFRPVSSVYRLFFITSDTVVEVIKPDWLITLERTPIPPLAETEPMDLVQWERSLDRK